MPITKKELDIVFTKNYATILSDAKKAVRLSKVSQEAAEVYVSESYLYVMKKIKQIETEDEIIHWIYKFVLSEIYWKNGTINRSNKKNNNKYDIGDYQYDCDFESLNDFSITIAENEDWDTKMAAIELYRQQIEKVDQIVLEVYCEKDKRTVRALAKHLNIKQTQSWHLIKNMKNEINEIYNNLKK